MDIRILQIQIKIVIFLGLFLVCNESHSTPPPEYPEDDWPSLSALLEDKNLPITWRDSRGRTISYYYLLYGSEDMAIRQIKKTKKAGNLTDSDVDRLLGAAIYANAQSAARFLLSVRNPKSKISLSESGALIQAASLGRLEMMRLLLNAKVNLYGSVGGDDAFETAFYSGESNAANLLVDSGLDISRYKDKKRRDKLFSYAISAGRRESLELLKRNSFDFNFRYENGDTLLANIIQTNASDKLAEIAVLFGSNPCNVNAKGETAKQLVERVHAKTIEYSRPKYISLYEGEFSCKRK